MPFVDVPAGRLHYRFDGPADAPVIVLSNSLGANLSMWDPQVPALASKFRVLRYDSRGHGLSAAPPGPYTIEGLGRDVIGLLDELGIRRVQFCGLSMGGIVGLWLGLHAAERLDGLVACNTAARVGTVEAWNGRIATVRKGGIEAVVPALLERWFTPGFRASAPWVVESTRRMLLESTAEGYVACCEAIRDADLRDQVVGIKVRTLVISGASDPVTPPADGRFLEEKISGARYVELAAAHLSNVEAVTQFTDALLQFLDQPEAK
jgi:3-oxoadipate enol-lactonase